LLAQYIVSTTSILINDSNNKLFIY
jgi:hypothetical protein